MRSASSFILALFSSASISGKQSCDITIWTGPPFMIGSFYCITVPDIQPAATLHQLQEAVSSMLDLQLTINTISSSSDCKWLKRKRKQGGPDKNWYFCYIFFSNVMKCKQKIRTQLLRMHNKLSCCSQCGKLTIWKLWQQIGTLLNKHVNLNFCQWLVTWLPCPLMNQMLIIPCI